MANVFLAVTMLVVLAAQFVEAEAHPSPDSKPFLLRFPRTIDTSDLSIHYQLTGAFGGYGSFVRVKSDVWDYLIDTSYAGKPAKTMKAIIYCPGFGVELLNCPSLADASVRGATVDLKPLPTLRLSGVVNLLEGQSVTDLKIEVVYVAFWSHEFFGIADGAVVTFTVASADLPRNGSFRVSVPNFANDMAVNSFRKKGVFKLIAREPRTGNIPYSLETTDRPGRDFELKIAEEYKCELILNARRRNDR